MAMSNLFDSIRLKSTSIENAEVEVDFDRIESNKFDQKVLQYLLNIGNIILALLHNL